MPVVVEAVPEPEYLAWLDKKKAEQAAAAGGADRAWSKDELMAKGKEVYEKQCLVCHQANGQGLPPAFPALTGSKIVTGPLLSPEGKLIKDSHVDRVLNGKANTAMQAFKGTLNDVELAAVITFERNALGNSKGDMIQPAQIKSLR
jgi:cytochrome c oxidase subunit 2